MKQPRTTINVPIIDENGDTQVVSRSIALEGWPSGPTGNGLIEMCPITSRVMWKKDMVRYKNRWYSPEGAEEEKINDRLRYN